MINSKCFFLAAIVIAIIVGFWLTKNRLQGFNVSANAECSIDEDCPGDNFCYMGKCWGYWKGYPMPWSTCRNPYCTSTDPQVNCAASSGKCLPYCKCTLNRGLGGSINKNCFPKCGTPCMSNDDCPAGCPACFHGICSAPSHQTSVL